MRFYISYDPSDTAQLQMLDALRTADGHGIWYEQDHQNADWQAKALRVMTAADAVLFIFSLAATQSARSRWDFQQAAQLGKPIVVVVAENHPTLLQRLARYPQLHLEDGLTPQAKAAWVAQMAALHAQLGFAAPLPPMPVQKPTNILSSRATWLTIIAAVLIPVSLILLTMLPITTGESTLSAEYQTHQSAILCDQQMDDRQYQAALTTCAQAIEQEPTVAVHYYHRGLAAFRLEQYEAASADFSQAIALDSTMALAYNGRCMAYHDLRRYTEALADCTQAIALDATFDSAYANRANAYASLENYGAAIEDLNQAISLDAESVWAFYLRCSVYNDMGHYQAALRDCDQALALNPDYVWAHNERGHIYYRQDDYRAALVQYTRAIELSPSEDNYFRNRCQAHYNLGDYLMALDDCSHALRLDPMNKSARSWRASTYEQLGKYQAMYNDATSLVENYPQDPYYYLLRSTALTYLKKPIAAAADLWSALKQDPTYGYAYRDLGNLAYDAGNYELAMEYYHAYTKDIVEPDAQCIIVLNRMDDLRAQGYGLSVGSPQITNPFTDG